MLNSAVAEKSEVQQAAAADTDAPEHRPTAREFCCNLACDVAKPGIECTRCGQCRYCSVACQRQAWTLGHALVCDDYADELLPGPELTLAEALQFTCLMDARSRAGEFAFVAERPSAGMLVITKCFAAGQDDRAIMASTQLGRALCKTGETAKGVEMLSFAISRVRQLETTVHTDRDVFNMHTYLANAYVSIRQDKKAAHVFEKACHLVDRLDHETVIQLQIAVSTCMLHYEDHSSAVAILETIVTTLETKRDLIPQQLGWLVATIV